MLGSSKVVLDSRGPSLVGRETELGQLEETLDALGQGSSSCLVVEGEPGIGKTRLLEELRGRAEERGYLVLSGAAAEFERDVPYSVWADALDAYVESQDLSAHDEWDAELEEELASILPSLKASRGPTDVAIADERYRAHRAVRRLLELIASPATPVLVLDDLHWSDEASIELVGSIVRRGTDTPLVLALAFRRSQAPERLAGALAASSVRRLELGQLSEADAGELLDDLDAPARAAIYSLGGGNPFYLEQLARASADGRLPHGGPASGRGVGVPAAVAASLAEELESLESAPRALLDAAAVLGEPFEPDVAAEVADLPGSDGLAALDDLLALDLVRPTQVPRRFTFRHPLVREAVYDAVPGGRRLAAHERAAAALAARGASAAERAHHVEQSARQGDEDAIALLLEAGADAAARAPAAAASWFDAALRVLPSDDTERQVSVRVALASALRSGGELERCRATVIEAIDRLPPESVVRRVELTTLCAAVEHWQGHHPDAHRRLTRAWEEVPDRSTAAAAALQIELAVDGLYELDFDQTLAMGRGALDTARTLGDAALIAAAASALSLGEAAAGNIGAARENRADALEHVDRLSDAELAPRLEALYYLGWAENYLEHFDEAIAHAERGIAIARATGEGRLLVPLMLVKGYPFEMQGRLAESVVLCETAIEAARLSANPHYLFWALFELGWAHYFCGDLDAALVAGEESERIGGRLLGGTMPSTGGGPGWLLAVARFEAGEVERAREAMRVLGSDDLEHKIPVERCFDWESMALAELALGRPDAAEDYVRRAEENAERLGLMVPAACAGRARAAVLLTAGEPLEAARVAGEAGEAADSVGARLQAAFANGLAGRGLAAAGEREQAIRVLRESERELDVCGSVRARDELRRELRKLGARAEKRGPATAEDSGVPALTKRELEIAELVTDRKTNKQIAAELFLSDKTIESHLRNIFIKLGVSSRVEVARTIDHHRRELAAAERS